MSQSKAATGVLIGPPNFEHPHPSLFHIRQHLLLRSTPKIDSLILKSGPTSTLSLTSQHPSQNGLGQETQTRPRPNLKIIKYEMSPQTIDDHAPKEITFVAITS